MSAEGQQVAHHSHAKFYIVIFVVLALLTVAELIAAEYQWSYAMKAASLTLLALGKAFLVAYYYMHLNEETKWMKFIAAIPLSAAIYAVVVILESLYR
jgi:cytochrome c oxidase subunit IV